MKDDFLSNKSEWNEQQIYSKLYFMIGARCRELQATGQYEEWRKTLDSKIVHVMPIIKDKKDEIKKHRKEISVIIGELQKGKDKSILLIELREKLFDFEQELDGWVNDKLPFLRIKTQQDIEDL